MNKRIRIVAVPNEELDVRKYVRALIAFARQLQEQEEQEQADRAAAPAASEETDG